MSKALGYQQITSLSGSTALTIAQDENSRNAGRAIISPETQNVRWRDDGVAPTASVGYLLAVGSELEYEGSLDRLRFIEVTASAKLNICYYKA